MLNQRDASVDVVVTRDLVIIQACGEFDAYNVHSLGQAFAQAAGHDRDVMLDLAAVSFIDLTSA